MNIAIVHDFLREYGGAERVVEAIHEMWPEAPVYTSFVDWDALGVHAHRLKNWDIRPSWVQHNWIVRTFHSPLRFVAPWIWSSFDLSEFDMVISSSGWFMCRGVAVTAPSVHICYIHHPPRNLYGYATGGLWQRYWPVRIYTSIINFFQRHYDFETAQRVDYFVANSKETSRRVEKFYRRDSTVIYPPVDTRRLHVSRQSTRKNYFLSVGRLVWSKRIDVQIKVANKMKLPLKIVGSGSEEESLRALAGPTIEFCGAVSDEKLDQLYSEARAVIFTALDEDFGIVPVESMGAGTPVIALAQGGVLETVVDGKTGILFSELTPESLEQAIQRFLKSKNTWLSACVSHAEKFSKERFQKEFRTFVNKHSPLHLASR